MDSFGKELRKLRDGIGLSREFVAASAGVSLYTLRAWERDKRRPKWRNLQRVIAVLEPETVELALLTISYLSTPTITAFPDIPTLIRS